jgi:hypothetical protein
MRDEIVVIGESYRFPDYLSGNRTDFRITFPEIGQNKFNKICVCIVEGH